MEQQFEDQAAVQPVKAKSGMGKMFIINVVVSALIALIVSLIVAAPLLARVKVLEQEMAKQMATYKTK